MHVPAKATIGVNIYVGCICAGWWMWHSFKAKNQDAKASDVYMIASTVSSKALRSVANLEGFNFEVGGLIYVENH